jgi:DNA-binding PadR family transcriptional regulator
MHNRGDPQSHLPLRPVEFEILLVLVAGDSHGYAIIKEAQERWPGNGTMETGTLYRALRRLTLAGMVEPSDRRPAPEADDDRRRYFAITPFGRAVAAAEARRMETQLDVARARDLLPGTEGGGS